MYMIVSYSGDIVNVLWIGSNISHREIYVKNSDKIGEIDEIHAAF